MKIVGKHNRSEFELNPQVAWQRGKVLDAMLVAALVPRTRGVWRLTHLKMNKMDFERQLIQAATVNKS
jgi:hypothetical protein